MVRFEGVYKSTRIEVRKSVGGRVRRRSFEPHGNLRYRGESTCSCLNRNINRGSIGIGGQFRQGCRRRLSMPAPFKSAATTHYSEIRGAHVLDKSGLSWRKWAKIQRRSKRQLRTETEEWTEGITTRARRINRQRRKQMGEWTAFGRVHIRPASRPFIPANSALKINFCSASRRGRRRIVRRGISDRTERG